MRGDGPRWRWWLWPVGVLATLAAAGVVRVLTMEVAQRQDRVVPAMGLVALGCAAVLGWSVLWLLALSRLPWARRLIGVVVVIAALGVAVALVRVGGVTGDVLPILEWRFASRPEPDAVPVAATQHIDLVLASGADYPQFLGPNRDGTVPGWKRPGSWDGPPRLMWRRPVGKAWSGFAVSGDYVVTQEQRGDQETVAAYHRTTGEPLWAHGDPVRWADPLGGPGPRATPSIAAGRVFAFGGTGRLNALDLRTGRLIWARDVLAEVGTSPPEYGVSASPLVHDGAVVVAAGGTGTSLSAYDAETGAPRWSAGDDPAAYSSPVVFELAGRLQIVILNGRNVVGHDPGDGHVLWTFPWPEGTQNTSQPLQVSADTIFVSSGYGVGARLIRVGDGGAELVWESLSLKAKFTNVVLHDGFVYGLDDGILVCVDPVDGRRRWKKGRHGHGQVMLAGPLLFVVGEQGGVSVVEADPDEYREVHSFAAVQGKTWNHAALAGRHLFVRNDREATGWELP